MTTRTPACPSSHWLWSPKQPHGRFLHLTDIHPDTHYTPYTRPSSACHNTHFGKKSTRVAGFWGTPVSDCDSPIRLVDLALDFAEQWADEVDWVVWTGDSARHDNDPQLARTEEEIEGSNQYLATRMKEVFWDRGVPVIPSIGNNDVWPHNVMYPGPSSTTRAYAKMWTPILSPLTNLSTLSHGLYFSTPLLTEHKVAAVSLNTLFFYDSNKAVDGCEDDDDPGTEQMVWLEAELERFRRDGWRVYLTGHVPPSTRNYYAGCYRRYGELALRFQDIILGHFYGHMNMDHYFWISLDDVKSASSKKSKSKPGARQSAKFPITIQGAHDYDHEDLMRELKALPREEKVDFADYAVVNVPASVVPTYFPGMRVYTYNVSGIYPPPPIVPEESFDVNTEFDDDTESESQGKKSKEPNPCKGQKKNSPTCVGGKPRHSHPLSATRAPGPFTPTGYAQYFLPGVEEAGESEAPVWELEYATYESGGNGTWAEKGLLPMRMIPRELGGHMRCPSLEAPESLADPEPDAEDPSEPEASKKKHKKKKAERRKEKQRERLRTRQLLPYQLRDLTIPSYLALGRRLAREEGVWGEFKRNMYVGTGEEE
ncbi:hypothetical protein DACRYDRAFT_96807 [Dacryopinax primogenitus]|uniref:Calcineurin-like phosphoesterase domain-containing protein n=1 Tax=Dacryopinax primogenitus (strain DJM 731) TaxID=1858805 RepID=M5FXN6_DACPD|nr:uncharacterized protein DACRYDRAFT_96807 [Dacryopinax primogenitus]EJT98271.1 hypothetical protein DACRYDRAFT_96807 [Dacryopinax primogenitus]